MGVGGNTALGRERLIQDEDFEDYQPHGGPSDESTREEADKKSSKSGDDYEGGEGEEDIGKIVNEVTHAKVSLDGNSTEYNKVETMKERNMTVGLGKKTRGGTGKFEEKPSRKSSRKRNAPVRYCYGLFDAAGRGDGIHIFGMVAHLVCKVIMHGQKKCNGEIIQISCCICTLIHM